jgi:hypothetical protein
MEREKKSYPPTFRTKEIDGFHKPGWGIGSNDYFIYQLKHPAFSTSPIGYFLHKFQYL